MTLLLIGLVIAVLFLAASLVLALSRPRQLPPAAPTNELKFDSPEARERLGRLQQ